MRAMQFWIALSGTVLVCGLGVMLMKQQTMSPRLSAPDPEVNRSRKIVRPPLAGIDAWEKAGAEAGWMSGLDGPDWQFSKDHPGGDALPAFRFFDYPSRAIGSLPSPGCPFGLWCNRTDDATLTGQAALKQLEALYLGRPRNELKTPTWTLAGLDRLRALSLQYGPEEVMKEVGTLKPLRSLACRVVGVSDSGLRSIAGLTQLRSLALNSGSGPLTDEGTKTLAGFWNLRLLALDFCPVTDIGLREVAGLTKLQLLSLRSCDRVGDAGLRELAGLKQLRSLDLSGTQVSDGGADVLAGLTQLESLSLRETQVSDAGLRHLTSLKQLRSLNLYHMRGLTDAGLAHLSGLDQLRSLDLGCHYSVMDAGLRHLITLRQLRSLNLASTAVTDAGLRHLAGFEKLEFLCLPEGVTGTGLAALSGLKQLRSVELHDGATDADLVGLGRLQSVESVLLFNSKVTDGGLRALAPLKQLRLLKIHYFAPEGLRVTDEGVRALERLLPQATIDLDAWS